MFSSYFPTYENVLLESLDLEYSLEYTLPSSLCVWYGLYGRSLPLLCNSLSDSRGICSATRKTFNAVSNKRDSSRADLETRILLYTKLTGQRVQDLNLTSPVHMVIKDRAARLGESLGDYRARRMTLYSRRTRK